MGCRESDVRGPLGVESMDKIRRATELLVAVPSVICVRRPRPAALLDVLAVEDGRPRPYLRESSVAYLPRRYY